MLLSGTEKCNHCEDEDDLLQGRCPWLPAGHLGAVRLGVVMGCLTRQGKTVSQGKGSSIIPILNGWNFPSQWKDSLPRDLLITQSFNHSELRVLFCFLNEEMLGYLTAGISVGTLCVLPEISVAFWVLWAQVHDSTTNEERLILSWE